MSMKVVVESRMKLMVMCQDQLKISAASLRHPLKMVPPEVKAKCHVIHLWPQRHDRSSMAEANSPVDLQVVNVGYWHGPSLNADHHKPNRHTWGERSMFESAVRIRTLARLETHANGMFGTIHSDLRHAFGVAD